MVIYSSFSHWKWWFFHSYVKLPEGIWNHQEWSRMQNFYEFLFNSFMAGFWFAGFVGPQPLTFCWSTKAFSKSVPCEHLRSQGFVPLVAQPGPRMIYMRSTCLMSLFEKQGCKRVCVCKYVRKNPYVCSRIYMQIIWLMNMYTYAIYIIMCVYKYMYIYIYYIYVHSCAQMDIP